MVPQRLCEYVVRYENLWSKEALGNFSLNCDKKCSSCLREKPIEKVPQVQQEKRLVKHIFLENGVIRTWLRHKSNKQQRALFLAPVGNQVYIDSNQVVMVIAGISTSAQAVRRFYQEMESGASFKEAAANAVYEGKMYRRIFEWLKREDFPIKNRKIQNVLEGLEGVSSYRRNPFISFTQRIKDASLGKSSKDKLIFVPENQLYSDSQAKFCGSDFSVDNLWMQPFLDEIRSLKSRPILWLLGSSQYHPRKNFLNKIKDYFSSIIASYHPMGWKSSDGPSWKII